MMLSFKKKSRKEKDVLFLYYLTAASVIECGDTCTMHLCEVALFHTLASASG